MSRLNICKPKRDIKKIKSVVDLYKDESSSKEDIDLKNVIVKNMFHKVFCTSAFDPLAILVNQYTCIPRNTAAFKLNTLEIQWLLKTIPKPTGHVNDYEIRNGTNSIAGMSFSDTPKRIYVSTTQGNYYQFTACMYSFMNENYVEFDSTLYNLINPRLPKPKLGNTNGARVSVISF